MAKQHLYEDVTDTLAGWLNDLPGQLAADMAGGSRAPFAANLTNQQKMAYYHSQVFNPDGTPNVQGRQGLIDRVGVQGYARVMKSLGKGNAAIPDHPLQSQIAQDVMASPNGGNE